MKVEQTKFVSHQKTLLWVKIILTGSLRSGFMLTVMKLKLGTEKIVFCSLLLNFPLGS